MSFLFVGMPRKDAGLRGKQPGEIALHSKPVGTGGGGKGVEDRAGFGALLGVAEQPVLAPDHERSDGVLCPVVVRGNGRIMQESIQILLFVPGILTRSGKPGAADRHK